jgi:hypothetical protein
MINIPSNTARLTDAMEVAPAHLKPVIQIVSLNLAGLLFVGQSDEPFRVPADPKRPAIIIIGDDLDRAVGPQGFHLPSLRRAIRGCTAFAVVSCEPLRHVYATIAGTAALSRDNVMLIETRPEHEIAWANLIRKLKPRANLILAVVEGGHA